MRTVSTKLDNHDFEKFQAMCNDDGVCASEELRDMINQYIQAWEEGKETESENESIPQIHGKILDDNGNVLGTF